MRRKVGLTGSSDEENLGIFSIVRDHLLNAAGTPMITPLPANSLAKLTFVPGEPSCNSTFGTRSPTRTYMGDVV